MYLVLLLFLSSIVICCLIYFFYVYCEYHPNSVLKPLNYLLRGDKSSRSKFYTPDQCLEIFPVSQILENNWKEIRDEGIALYYGLNKNINILNEYNVDLGHEDKKGWTMIPLRLFGSDSLFYLNQCPIIKDLLKNHPEIISCLFSIMEPGKIIQQHKGPYDGILHYQLGLKIPILDKNDDKCFLEVGGEKYYWKDGEGIMFDETNLHSASNLTSEYRMVLLIDLKRPYLSQTFKLINNIVLFGMGQTPVTKRALML